jgi:hypothetical protein
LHRRLDGPQVWGSEISRLYKNLTKTNPTLHYIIYAYLIKLGIGRNWIRFFQTGFVLAIF